MFLTPRAGPCLSFLIATAGASEQSLPVQGKAEGRGGLMREAVRASTRDAEDAKPVGKMSAWERTIETKGTDDDNGADKQASGRDTLISRFVYGYIWACVLECFSTA
jgi:hypothetical protein